MMSGKLMQRLRRSNSVEALSDSPPPGRVDVDTDEKRRKQERIYTRQRFDSQSSTSSSDVDDIVDAREKTTENSAVNGAERQEQGQHVVVTTASTSPPGKSRAQKRASFGKTTQAIVQDTPRMQGNMKSVVNPIDENTFIERAETHFANDLDITWIRKQAPKVIVEERKKEPKDELEKLFKGTEQQVLYKVNNLIHQRIDLNAVISKGTGDGLLHKAVKKKFVKVAERLLDNGASLSSKNNIGHTPLQMALGIWDEVSKDVEEKCCCSWFESVKEYIQINFMNEEPEKHKDGKNDVKCDEMAEMMISKLKPKYVRHLFGDDTDFDESAKSEENQTDETRSASANSEETGRNTYIRAISEENQTGETSSASETPEEYRSEPANTRYKLPTPPQVENHSHVVLQEQTTTPQSLPESKESKPFKFLNIVKDKDMLKTAITILDKLEDTDPNTKEPVVYYKLLSEDGKDKKEEEVFQYIVRQRHELINHPVVRAVIHWKWTRKFHRRYLFDFVKFFVSFVAITICAVVGAQSDHVQLYDTPWQYVRAALEILMCIFILTSLRLEFLQFYIEPLGYVKSVLNWVEFGSALCLVISIALRYGDVNAHWYLFAVGYVFWTVKGLKYCAIYRHADAYKETLRALIKRDLILFIVFFVALEMLFGGTLLLVLRGTNALNVEPDTESILSIYYIGLRTVIDGQTPESLNVDNLPRVGEFVIIVFNALTIVVMLNILIAQLSNTYQIAYLEGQIKSWVNRAEAIVCYEKEDNCNLFGMACPYDSKNQPNSMTSGQQDHQTHPPEEQNNSKRQDTQETLKEKKKSRLLQVKIPFDKEKLQEEKEKVNEMRAILKQVDKTLLHTDLSVQTMKSKQTALLQDKKERPKSTTSGSHDQSDLSIYAEKIDKQLNDLKAQQGKMKSQQEEIKLQQDEMKKQQEAIKIQQDSILEAVGDIRNLLQKHE